MNRLVEIQKLRFTQAAAEYGHRLEELRNAKDRKDREMLQGIEKELLQTIDEAPDGSAWHAAMAVACIGRLRFEAEQKKRAIAGCAAALELAAKREQDSRKALSRRRAMLRATERLIERKVATKRLSDEMIAEDSRIEAVRKPAALTPHPS